MGEDSLSWFVDKMMQFEKEEMNFYKEEKRLHWDNSDAFKSNSETHCFICKKPFITNQSEKDRDRDHVTGQ